MTISAATLAGLLGFILALVVVWRLVAARKDTSHTPTLVGDLIGFALGIIVWQSIQEAITLPAPTAPDSNTAAKLVEAERQAREQAIKGLNTRLDSVASEIASVATDVKKLVDADLNSRVTALERRPIPAPPPTPAPPAPPLPVPKVTLNAAQVRLVQTRGAPPALFLQPQINAAAGSIIRSADISFCPPPGIADCVPAPETDHCGHSLVCNGLGKFVSIPPKVRGAEFCLKLQFELQDQTQGVAMGGPLQTRDGASWQRDAATPSQCDQVSSKQATTRQ